MNIVCFGDSITQAAEFPVTDRWPSILQCRLNEWRPGEYRVYNRGIGGNTSAQGFDRLERDVLPYLPALLLVQFGFNDANVRDWAQKPRVGLGEYRANLREFHRITVCNGGICVFIVNHRIARVSGIQGNGSDYAVNFEPYNSAVRELACELGAPVIDLPARMERGSVAVEEFVAADGLHLSRGGNHRYAEMIFTALEGILVLPRICSSAN